MTENLSCANEPLWLIPQKLNFEKSAKIGGVGRDIKMDKTFRAQNVSPKLCSLRCLKPVIVTVVNNITYVWLDTNPFSDCSMTFTPCSVIYHVGRDSGKCVGWDTFIHMPKIDTGTLLSKRTHYSRSICIVLDWMYARTLQTSLSKIWFQRLLVTGTYSCYRSTIKGGSQEAGSNLVMSCHGFLFSWF